MIVICIAGEKQRALAERVAQNLDADFMQIPVRHFADGEASIASFDFDKLKNRNVLLVHRFFALNHDTFSPLNAQLFDVLYLLCMLKACKASSLTALLPYLPYSRQDQSDIPGFSVGLCAVSDLMKKSGIEKVISSDIHSDQTNKLVGVPFINIGLEDFWAQHIKKVIMPEYENVCLASPDFGGKERVQAVATQLGVDVVAIKKTRIGPDQPVALELHGDVMGKTVVIIDDILDTGKTAINACTMLLENGAAKVLGCFSHAVFSEQSQKRLEQSSFIKIYCTDTVLSETRQDNQHYQCVSINDFLSKKVSGLFS